MDLAIALDRKAAIPLHRQLYEELRRAILERRLSQGQRLPSTRLLAKSLGVSRLTVTQSYEQLIDEGYLQTIVGSGTFVCTQLPDDLLHSASSPSENKMARLPIKLSHYAAVLTEIDIPNMAGPNTPISFRYGRPAFDQFPIQLWRKLLFRHSRASLDWLDYASDPLGHRPLREAIAHYLSRSRAVQCEPDQILLVGGTQQALDLIARLLVNPDETIALEEPSYLAVRRHTFLSQGAKLLPIPVDESGLVVEQLAKFSSDNIKLVYVTPSHQFPTGAVLSLQRRLELLSWAQQTTAIIIEDDYDSEYRYEGQPIPALQGLHSSNTVVYIGSFSKMLFPSLRIGYLVLPQQLIPVFARAKWLIDRQLPLLEQHVLADFIQEGYLERHLRRMRLYYDQRRQVLVQAIKVHLGERATILGENAGIHLIVRLHTNLSDEDIIHRARRVGVGMVTTKPYYLQAAPSGEFIFGYSALTVQQLEEGIHKLTEVLC
ncbi:MocR-like pyridoxine biosynthesis transcription factor PdxR [Fischerella sp. PCC 9605]|uniref:MocR-like pyridoxine biosynthesis transcription factor PdxR n=1 Tax=Fischerella sp. PCC 9605 TaxID=1173024 RepID=UPI00047D52BA|nr:PLP-dependent aminotransferase family protein [Fischerella sp. PCC 9605]